MRRRRNKSDKPSKREILFAKLDIMAQKYGVSPVGVSKFIVLCELKRRDKAKRIKLSRKEKAVLRAICKLYDINYNEV